MRLNGKELSKAVRYALYAGAATAVGLTAAPVFAQSDDAGSERLETIVVTGSRIRKVDIETSQPVFSIDKASIEHQGLTSVADILQRLSANGAAISRQFNNGGDGSAGISLRNLGENRTLVLVNGKRWSQGLSGSVDLNTIPVAAIERVDVLKDGASTIYGSDAIAGVVNIITRQRFDGAEARVYYGQFDQDDGVTEAADFTIGSTTEKSSILIGASYAKEGEVMGSDRKITSNPDLPYNPGFSATGAPGAFSIPGRAGRWVYENGALRAYRGRDGADPGDGAFTANDNYVLTPQERTSFFAQGSYNIFDNLTFKTDAMYNERISEQLLAAMPVGGLTLSADSIYNPFNGTPEATDLTSVSRRFYESGGRSFNQNVKSWHFSGGLEGFFDVGDHTWNWDAGYNYNKTDELTVTNGLFNVARLAEAYGPSAIVNGTPVCLDAPGGNVIAGCVPLNPLGPIGSITPEALAYVGFGAHDVQTTKSIDYTANLTGTIVELPAGPLAFAAGVEYRKESGSFEPDAFISSGYSTGNAAQPTAGAYSLKEGYLELSIPVLRDLPGVNMLEFNVAGRFSDYSNFGDTTNGKFGFKWKPIEDLLVRGNYSEGFRAPTINNLFLGASDSYEYYDDPCSTQYPGGVGAFCDSALIPARARVPGGPNTLPGTGQQQTLEPFTWTSNPDLNPETSTTKTLGFVYSPKFISGFDFSLDWWQIDVKGAISRLGGQYILDKCYQEGVVSLCDLITRDPNHYSSPYYITDLEQPVYNLGGYKVEGYDLTVNYRLPETAFGRFSFTWDSSYVADNQSQATPESEWDHDNGRYYRSTPNWRLRSNLTTDWTLGNFGATWSARYYSSLSETCTFGGANAQAFCTEPDRVGLGGELDARNHLGATTYHDAQFRWTAPWDGTIAVGANNIFNKSPPRAGNSSANNFDQQYLIPGVFYYAEYRQRF